MPLHDRPAGTDVGTELSYVPFTGNVSVTATTEGTANTVVTAGAFIADGVSAYLIEFYCYAFSPDNTVSRTLSHYLYLDGASIGRVGVAQTQVTSVNLFVPFYIALRVVPAAGSRTYSWRAAVSAGTGTIFAAAGGSGSHFPGYIRITKVS